MQHNHCSSCQGSCGTCHEVENPCPVCGAQGLEIPFVTVQSLVKPEINNLLNGKGNDAYYLCLNRACEVAYFTNNNIEIDLSELTVPIWFKNQKSEYRVCYCRNITLNDIVLSVRSLNQDDITVQDVLKDINKENMETDCLHNNPTSLCCDRLFENAIQYALKHK